jgi:hypothetical protein
VLSPDIPPTFREMISKCLSRNPEDRPDVARLQVWQKGGELEPMPASEQETDATNVAQAEASSTSTRLIIRAKLMSQDEITEPVELKAQWRPVPLIIAAAVLLVVVGAGIYFFAPREIPAEARGPVVAPRVAAEAPRPEAQVAQAPATDAPLPVPAAQAPATEAPLPAPAAQAPTTEAPLPAPADRAPASDSPSAIIEVIPVVPRSASQTIRGTVRVSVRVIVDDDGNVVAATAEDPGPSRYFERLSLDAAKQWTFAHAETGGNRLMLVKFNYSRSGTTAKASPAQ